MCIALIGGMDRLERCYVMETERVGPLRRRLMDTGVLVGEEIMVEKKGYCHGCDSSGKCK
jgi:Fe2+ transport system protein FeoA